MGKKYTTGIKPLDKAVKKAEETAEKAAAKIQKRKK